MRFLDLLDGAIKKNNSLLCVGLDVDLKAIPERFLKSTEPLLDFNRFIIETTKDFVCAYKPNSAFYEMAGIQGIAALKKTIDYIRALNIPVILDAKRGDIGHSSAAYAKSAFEYFQADAVTVNPYLGFDSVKPFLDYKEKGVFVLCLTSNPGHLDFQIAGDPLYLKVARKVKEWDTNGNCGLVVGATNPEELKTISGLSPEKPILIPGIGTQGGDLASAVKYGGRRPIINASRSIIYAADPGAAAKKTRDEINKNRSY